MNTSPQHSPVRLALLGVGGHGRTQQDAIEETDAVELRSVFDVDEAALEEAAHRFGVNPASSYENLLRREDLEAIVIATPNALHRRQAEAALDAGLDVLLEKPIAASVSGGRAVIEAAEDAGRMLMIGHDMRRSREARQTKRVLREGTLGRVVSMEIHFSTDTAIHLDESSWRLQAEGNSFLPMTQLGIHGVDLVQYFLEPISSVYAEARSVTTPPEVVDSVAATFRTRNGVHGTLISNYCSDVTFEYRISGTRATVESNGHALQLQRSQEAGENGGSIETKDYSAYSHESYVRQMEAFAEAVQNRTEIETDGWVGLQALATVEAFQRSIEKEAPQSVPDMHSAPVKS